MKDTARMVFTMAELCTLRAALMHRAQWFWDQARQAEGDAADALSERVREAFEHAQLKGGKQ